MFSPQILVVDDEDTIRHILKKILGKNGCEIRDAASAEEAIPLLEGWSPDVAMLDIVLPGMNGLQLLGEVKQRSRDTEVLVMTSNASADTALEAMRKGAYDYVKKPFNLQEVWVTVQRALEKRTMSLQNRALLDRQELRNRELSNELSIDPKFPLSEGGSVREIVDYFLDLVCTELGARRASVMLLDTRTNELEIISSSGIEGVDPKDVRVPIGEGIAGHVAKTGEPFLVADVETDVRVTAGGFDRRCDGTSFISAPIAVSVAIKSDQSILGVINLTDRDSRLPFEEADVTFLTNLAGQLAAALEGARRSDQLAHAYESLKETQDQLVFSERIKAVGQMATGVAHDFNNVLSVILARAQFARQRIADPQPDLQKIESDLETIMRTSLQAAEVIKRIQDYTRIRKDVPNTPVDLNKVVEEAVEMSRPKWKEWCDAEGRPVEVTMDLQPVPKVSGNVFELTQVVGNLIFNAIEAMPEGGDLRFRTSTTNGVVTLEVEDNGTGMDADTLEHLFEPFFTTKEEGQGLGTSIIYGIVTRHRGEIHVDSEKGRGTHFTISMPELSDEHKQEVSIDATAPVTSGSARILLVDDDEMVRETYEEALSLSGHEVVAAPGGEAAIELFEAGTFDVVITDLSMGGMSGLQLSKRLKQLAPDVPVILLSGWAVQQDEDRIRDAGITSVLVKPCLIEDLLQSVHNVQRTPVGARV